MKLLFDQNLSFKLAAALGDCFPHSSQARLLGLETASDFQIWNYAAREGFVIVSLDADFAEMSALYGPPPRVIWLRFGNRSTRSTEMLFRRRAADIDAWAADLNSACLELYGAEK